MSIFKNKCGKQIYKNRALAKKTMKRLNKTDGYDLTDIYFCEACNAYHVTSMPKIESRNYKRFLNQKKA